MRILAKKLKENFTLANKYFSLACVANIIFRFLLNFLSWPRFPYRLLRQPQNISQPDPKDRPTRLFFKILRLCDISTSTHKRTKNIYQKTKVEYSPFRTIEFYFSFSSQQPTQWKNHPNYSFFSHNTLIYSALKAKKIPIFPCQLIFFSVCLHVDFCAQCFRHLSAPMRRTAFETFSRRKEVTTLILYLTKLLFV